MDIFTSYTAKTHPDSQKRAKKFVRKCSLTKSNRLLALAVRLCGVVAVVHDEILGPVVVAAGEVLVEDGLGAVGVSLDGVSIQLHREAKSDRHTFWASIEVPDMWGTMALPPPHGFCA